MKNKDICDNDLRCIMSYGLMVDEIIMDHIKRTQSSHEYKQGHYCVFTQMDTNMIYIYRGSLQDLHWKKGTYECIDMSCGIHLCKNTIMFFSILM